jgi:hypothetical protein
VTTDGSLVDGWASNNPGPAERFGKIILGPDGKKNAFRFVPSTLAAPFRSAIRLFPTPTSEIVMANGRRYPA